MKYMDYFCPKCGNQTSIQPVGNLPLDTRCQICQTELKVRERYVVPLVGDDGSKREVLPEEVKQAIEVVKEGYVGYRLIDDREDAFNVKVNGELNGIDTGKKIREKNEQLKKKVAGYEGEQKNLRADIEAKVAAKHKQEGINQ